MDAYGIFVMSIYVIIENKKSSVNIQPANELTTNTLILEAPNVVDALLTRGNACKENNFYELFFRYAYISQVFWKCKKR
jgi:hypothetical protein